MPYTGILFLLHKVNAVISPMGTFVRKPMSSGVPMKTTSVLYVCVYLSAPA